MKIQIIEFEKQPRSQKIELNNLTGRFNIKNKAMISTIVIGTLLSGCASMKESIVTGVGFGAATGAIVGSESNKNNRNQGALTGALVGAAIGGISSYIIHGSLEKREAKTRKQTLLNLDKYSVSTPPKGGGVQDFRLSAPDVDKECFDWEVKGNQLVQQHCVWSIKGNSFWMPSQK